MADPKTTLISGPYGSEFVPVPEVTDPSAPVGTGVQPDGPRVPLTDNALQNEPGISSGRAGREARTNQVEASMIETAGAAAWSWDTSRLVRRAVRPAFSDDTPISQYEYLDHIPLVLSDDEREYFMKVGTGQKSAAYAINEIETRRSAQQAIGQHELVAFAASMADPMWLAIPPAVRLGKTSNAAGRAIAGATGAAIAGAVTASGEGPVNDTEIAMSMLLNGTVAAAVYKPHVGFVPRDPTFPQAGLDKAVADARAGHTAAQGNWTGTPVDAQVPGMPPGITGGIVNSEPHKVSAAVDKALTENAKERGLGDKMQWNMRKTMASYSKVGDEVANLLYDNNSDLSLTSIESIREAVHSDLMVHQLDYGDALRAAMASQGADLSKTINPLTTLEAFRTQRTIEAELQREMFRREQLTRQGREINTEQVPKHIAEMADSLDKLHARALAELKAAGVEGADNLLETPGWLHRKWSSLNMDDAINKMTSMGLTAEQSLKKLHGLVGLSVRRANTNMSKELADQVGQAIVDRTMRKGFFEDSAFNGPVDEAQLKQVRDILKSGKMKHVDIERVLDVLRVESDDAGKQGFMKHRMDLDYRATIRIGAEDVSVMDLIDSRVTDIADQYGKRVATSVAFAQKGLKKPSDIVALRDKLSHGTDVTKRKEAIDQFDNTIAYFRGEASGASMNNSFRLAQAYTRMVALAWSGLWQGTEYANMMAEYGLSKTLKYAAQEIPGFKAALNPSKNDARTLNNVLADHSSQSMRMRPYLARYEDGYAMDMGDAMQLSAQQAAQLVPYANGMKYVHHHQAKVVGNLILDRLDMAAKGNTQAREALAKFGLEYPVMDEVGKEIQKHGFRVDDWDNEVWNKARPAFAKMMDTAVLKGRLGDIPAFAAFDPIGKFLFTFKSFSLVAQNKLLAGGLSRNGLASVSLMMMYQFPLALAAVQAQSVLKGQGALSEKDMVSKGIGQMGGLGLFSEPFKWATGESNSVGAPGLIALDRGVRMFQGVAQGDMNKAATSAMTLMPVANANPIFNAMVQHMKDNKKDK